MPEFILAMEHWLPRQPEDVFDFYADAFNLERLTPPWLRFEVVTPAPITMRPGAEIDYRLRLHGLPLKWRSRITAWDPPHRFVDEQIRGPYRTWIHEHTFRPYEGGALVGDRVQYAIFGGWLADRLLVRRDLRRIFAFRQQRLAEIFRI
jgi:ligand-binding SRPBCC domain-containing protein